MSALILAIDCSSEDIHIGISEGGSILLAESFQTSQNQSQILLKTIEQCLKKANVKLENVDAFATTLGPGSFTGTRTSLGTMKGFAFTLKKPLIGISTLYAMAYPCKEYTSVIPTLQAKKDFLYAALYENTNGVWLEKTSPRMIPTEQLSKLTTSPTTLIGSFIRRHIADNPDLADTSLVLGNSKFDSIHATTLCEISYQKYTKKEFEDVGSVEPLYIQKTAAEGYV